MRASTLPTPRIMGSPWGDSRNALVGRTIPSVYAIDHNSHFMTAEPGKKTPPATQDSPLSRFLHALESRTSDPIHLRLLKAAHRPEAAAALERELRRIMEDLLEA